MSAQHTPGDWHVHTNDLWSTVHAGDTLVADVIRNSDDARLIAAAPDLLAALRACVDLMQSAHLPGGRDFVEYAAARAAIARAEGREP